MNHLWFRLFCARKGDLDSNQLTAYMKTLVSTETGPNYQAAIWRQSLQSCPQMPSPVGYGWSIDEGKLIVNWMSAVIVVMPV